MSRGLDVFEGVVREVGRTAEPEPPERVRHPFEVRDIHDALPTEVRKLFDNAHYSQATLEACKFLNSEVRRISGSGKSEEALMMDVLDQTKAVIKLTNLKTTSEIDEQRGYRFIFAGTMVGVRNPRAHDPVTDEVGTCLDHLSLVSHLFRRLEKAGYKIGK